MSNNLYIIEVFGGRYEEAWDGSTVYVSREQAETAFHDEVEKALHDWDLYTSAYSIALYDAIVDEHGAVVVRSYSEPIHEWEIPSDGE